MRKRNDYLISRSRKGNAVLDTLMLLVVLFALALLSIWGRALFTDMNNNIQTDPDASSLAKNMSQSLSDRYTPTMDGAFAVVFVILWITLIVASFSIDSHPLFFGVMVIVMLFVLMAAAVLGNTYDEFVSGTDLSTASASFTIQNFIMTHTFEVFCVVGFSVIVALYMKTKL